ncbi:MAG TPA: class I SAM-dependent methyltransferase [Flavobacteriales bacterium]
MSLANPFEQNKAHWNAKVEHHVASKFYDVEGFVAGRNSLTPIELELLGDVQGKRVLHLQCHFGQDTLSLARLGAEVTGLDLSDAALTEARKLAERCGLKADFVEANVLDHQPQLDGRFDIVLTSYGTIGWLPDLEPWAANIQRYLKPGGQLIFVEFHPVMWMFDNDFTHVQYSYFNRGMIVETETGTYADREAPIQSTSNSWNHGLGEVLGALLRQGFRIERFEELDGSPFDCFARTVQGADGLYRIQGMEGRLPMVYALRAQATGF